MALNNCLILLSFSITPFPLSSLFANENDPPSHFFHSATLLGSREPSPSQMNVSQEINHLPSTGLVPGDYHSTNASLIQHTHTHTQKLTSPEPLSELLSQNLVEMRPGAYIFKTSIPD